MPVMEAAEKEVAVKVGWLEKSIPNTRHEGEGIWLSSRSQQEQAAAPTSCGHILDSFGKAQMRM